MSQSIIPSQTSLHDAALTLASAGFAVLPAHTAYGAKCSCQRPDCRSPGKHPKIADWVHRATSDPEQVSRRSRKWPEANLGVRTGIDGLIVVDIDPRNGGNGSLEELQKEIGRLPDTVTVLTGGGGKHLYFQTDFEVKSGSSILGAGIDIKGKHGFVIAPPSHHASGKRYEWIHAPWDVPISPLPHSIQARLRSRHAVTRQKREGHHSYWTSLSQAIVRQGMRNDALVRLTGHLLGRHVHPRVAACLVHAFNQTRVLPPLSDAEVNGILDRIAHRELLKGDF